MWTGKEQQVQKPVREGRQSRRDLRRRLDLLLLAAREEGGVESQRQGQTQDVSMAGTSVQE